MNITEVRAGTFCVLLTMAEEDDAVADKMATSAADAIAARLAQSPYGSAWSQRQRELTVI